MVNTTLAMVPSWDCLEYSSFDKEEELRRYFHRVDLILNELKTNYYVDTIDEQEQVQPHDDMSIAWSSDSLPTVSMLSDSTSISSGTTSSSSGNIVRPVPQRTALRMSSAPRRRRGSRSRQHYSLSTAEHAGLRFSGTLLVDLVQYLDELRLDGARNPFEEDSTPQEISKDVEQFIVTNTTTSSNLLAATTTTTPLVIKPIALRANDIMVQQRRVNV